MPLLSGLSRPYKFDFIAFSILNVFVWNVWNGAHTNLLFNYNFESHLNGSRSVFQAIQRGRAEILFIHWIVEKKIKTELRAHRVRFNWKVKIIKSHLIWCVHTNLEWRKRGKIKRTKAMAIFLGYRYHFIIYFFSSKNRLNTGWDWSARKFFFCYCCLYFDSRIYHLIYLSM